MSKRSSEACRHSHAPRPLALSPDETVERGAALLRAMGDPARLRLLERLAMGGAHCVSELAEAAGSGMSTVSQRLRLLHDRSLVTRRREGKHIYYELADDHVAALVRAALDHAAEPTGET